MVFTLTLTSCATSVRRVFDGWVIFLHSLCIFDSVEENKSPRLETEVVVQKFTSEELAKFKAADPDDVVCVRVGQIAVLIEQIEQLLAKDVRSEEEKAEYRSKFAVLEQRISDLDYCSKLNSDNSSKPPSSDGLSKETVEKKKEKEKEKRTKSSR